MNGHLDENQIGTLLEGRLDPQQRTAIESHLVECDDCRELVAASALALSTAPVARASKKTEATRETGTPFGRYLILQTIGTGAMGIVYTAYDPSLDRKVAIKILHNEARITSSEGPSDLFAEAKAMAKLSDPHVVTVFEVGKVDEQVFLAMEYISGTTLTKWLADEKNQNDTEKKIRVLLDAARGLSAAHKAGIIHRDFKPDNILVDHNDRAHVTDFGLARSSLVPIDNTESISSQDLQQTRALVGTPAYMAPEQMRAEKIDHRADQYSFCVTAYEALLGESPFELGTLAQLEKARSLGQFRTPLRPNNISTRIVEALKKGMHPEPAKRHQSLDELIAIMGQQPRQRMLGVVTAAMLGLAMIAVLGMQYYSKAPTPTCPTGNDKFEAVWNNSKYTSTKALFSQSGLPYAEQAIKAFDSSVRAYGSSWATMYQEACEATHVRGVQSASVMDRRMQCLNRRLIDVEAAVALMGTAERSVIENANSIATGLGAISSCSEKRILESSESPNLSQAQKVLIETSLANARNRLDTANYAKGVEVAGVALAQSKALHDRWHEAEALLLLGELIDRSGDPERGAQHLTDAVEAATVTRQDEIVLLASAELVRVEGVRRAKPDVATIWERLGLSVLQRLGTPANLEAKVRMAIGRAKRASGNYKTAQKELERAVSQLESQTPEVPLELAAVFNELGLVLRDLGEWEQARTYQNSALELQRERLGQDHPAVASTLRNLADLDWRSGRSADGVVKLKAALSIQERSLGAEHLEYAYTLNQLANTYSALEEYTSALSLYEKACALGGKTLANDHPEAAMCRMNIAMALAHLNRYAEALEILEASRKIIQNHYGQSHHFVAMIESEIANVLLNSKSPKQALERYHLALQIDESAVGKDHRDNADYLLGIAESLIQLGRGKEAISLLERAISLRTKGGNATQQARPRFLLAKVLMGAPTPENKTRAKTLAKEAREYYATMNTAGAKALAEIDTWVSANN